MHLFDKGWNKLRDQIFANQKKLGVIPQDAKLTPWPHDLLKNWDELNDVEKKLFIRQADVYAAYLAYTDHEIGRVIQAVKDMGKLDDTLIIYISGDNGASAEGSPNGTPSEMMAFNGVNCRPEPDEMVRRLGHRPDLQPLRGAVGLGVRYALQMDQADPVVLRRHAQRHGDLLARPHQGEGRDPLAVPPRDRRRADDPRSRPASPRPTWSTASRRSLSKASAWPIPSISHADAPSPHKTQYFEMMGVQGLYNDGWMLSAVAETAAVGTARQGDRRSGDGLQVRTLRRPQGLDAK